MTATGLQRNFFWMLASKAAIVLAALITWSLMNRSLGPADRGFLAEMQTWVGLFMAGFGISIDTAIYHFANKAVYGDDDKSRFITILSLSFLYAFLASAALIIFVSFWPQQVSSKTIQFLTFLILLLFFNMQAAYLTVFFQALGNIRFSALIGMLQAAINILMIGGGYALGFLNLRYAVVALVVVQAASLALIIVKGFRTGFFKGQFSKVLAKGMITAGLKQHLGTISTYIYTRINQLIVFKYCGEAQAGLFAVSLTLSMSLIIIPYTYQAALYPRVIQFADDSEVTMKSLRLGFYVWGGITLIIVALARPLLLMYAGPAYVASVGIFRILMIAAWFLSLSTFIAPYYIKKGAFVLYSLSAVFLAFFGIGINYLLVPSSGPMGAAVATAITSFIGFGISLLLFYHLSKRNPLEIFRPDFKNEIEFVRQLYRNITKLWE